MSRINVMQLTDTLDAGGAERVAVNFANLLPRDEYASWMCTTRHEGSLAALIRPDVGRVMLNRRARFDVLPVRRLVRAIDEHKIEILHTHSSALFVGLVAAAVRPHVSVVWHIHDSHQTEGASDWPYRLAGRRVSAAFAVSERAAAWATSFARISSGQVVYLPNFSLNTASPGHDPAFQMPGAAGRRITCVANIRPLKDHGTLLAAFEKVLQRVPDAHLVLVGGASDTDEAYRRTVEQQIARRRLGAHVSMLGERANVGQILAASDIGVLTSTSEGFPLALVEYGQAGLPVVATRVGQCGDVLRFGAAGLLVEPRNVEQLSSALVRLLQSPEERRRLGRSFQRSVHERYEPDSILRQMCQVYERIARSQR